MPNSTSSVRVVPGGGPDLQKAITVVSSLGDLIDMVPAPFRPRTQDLVNRVYKAAIKSNHARSYLSTLEKHLSDGTLPSEIGGRVHNPAIQISKEFGATAEWKTFRQVQDASTTTFKQSMLKSAIDTKKAEVTYLQGLFSEKGYKSEVESIRLEVTSSLAEDAGVSATKDGSITLASLPSWVRNDCETFRMVGELYPQRAIALAYTQVQQEMSKKFKTLTLKKSTDEDIEMQDASSKTETVDVLVSRKVEQLLKEYKVSKPGKPVTLLALRKDPAFTNIPRQWEEGRKAQSQSSKTERADSEGYKVPKRKRKRERQEESLQEVAKLERAFRGVVQTHLRVSTGGSVVSGSHTLLGSPLSDVRRKDRAVVSTHEACLFLDRYSDLFCGTSAEARRLFVSRHTPVHIFQAGHRFADGVFKGPGVVIPQYIEYKLAMNSKFVLHHSPNLLRVHQAWPRLERSVRLRWHFRNSERLQSKFYVPSSGWQPDPEYWNSAIERGLEKGKDLLFNQTADLNLSTLHQSNPDLRALQDFLEMNSFLVKITDKNLGLAVLSKPWYDDQCLFMLSDASTYEQVSFEDVNFYRTAALERIDQIVMEGSFSSSTQDYLVASKSDAQIPEFHAIPKVHKSPWKLRPIIPSHSWATRRASEVSDFILRELHKQEFPWIVDSTKEVISRLEKKTVVRSDNVWLVTGDVEAFYTNVSVADTIDQIEVLLQGRSPYNGVDCTNIAALLQVVMFCNCFSFNEKFFRQTNGIAMGTSCAPSFANVNLGFKEQFVDSIARLSTNPVDGLIFYVRYIDDIFLVFKGSKTACQSCLDDLSTKLQPFKIDWKINSSFSPTPFLDAEFFFEQGFGPVGVQSRVFRKKMNQHQYIPWSSAHPDTVKKAFVKAELTRYMIISSTKKLFEEKVSEFMQALGRRGYPPVILHVWKKQVQYEDRQYSLSKRKDSVRGLPLLLHSTYDEVWEYLDLKKVFNVMRDEWMKCEEPIPLSLIGPLIKSLNRSENLFDKFSSWNKAVLRGLRGSVPVLPFAESDASSEVVPLRSK